MPRQFQTTELLSCSLNTALWQYSVCYLSLVIVGILIKNTSLQSRVVPFPSATVSLNGLALVFHQRNTSPISRLKKQQLCGNTY